MTSTPIEDSQPASQKLPLVDLAWLWMAGFFGVLGGAATLAVLELDDERLYRAVLQPLYPGLAIAARMNADAHITRTLLVASLVNATVYAVAIVSLRLLWRALRNPDTFKRSREVTP